MFSSALFPGLGSCDELVRVIFFLVGDSSAGKLGSAVLVTPPLLLGSLASGLLAGDNSSLWGE